MNGEIFQDAVDLHSTVSLYLPLFESYNELNVTYICVCICILLYTYAYSYRIKRNLRSCLK